MYAGITLRDCFSLPLKVPSKSGIDPQSFLVVPLLMV